MPWQLTAPITTGDLDSEDYSEVKIVQQQHDSKNNRIMVILEYGNTDESVWVPGVQPASKETSVIIEGSDYTDLITNSEPEAEETTYEATKRALYEYLLSKSIIGAGSVV